jgi:DNA-binding response OmpR family regulator
MSETETILLLESEIIARQPLAAYLRDCGFKVLEAATAAEARALLENRTITVDLLLADASADAPSIFALAQWARSAFPSITVILSGTVGKTAAQAGDLCDEGPALVKPYDHQRVLAHIKQQLAARLKL